MAAEKTEEELIKAYQAYMWAFWAGGVDKTPPCIRCHQPAVTLHEITPRSMYRNWYLDTKWNSVPICDVCHSWAESAGHGGRAELNEAAVKRLQTVKEWNPKRIIREIEDGSNGSK